MIYVSFQSKFIDIGIERKLQTKFHLRDLENIALTSQSSFVFFAYPDTQ